MITFEELVTKYPWITPIVYELLKNLREDNTFSKDDLVKIGLSKSLVKTCTWILTKLKIIENISTGRYRIRDEFLKYRDRLSELNIFRFRNKWIFKFQKMFYIVTLKKKRLTTRSTTVDLIQKIIQLLQENRDGLTLRDLRNSIDEKMDKICTAVKILQLLKIVERVEKNEHILYRLSVTDPSLINRIFR